MSPRLRDQKTSGMHSSAPWLTEGTRSEVGMF